MMSGHARSPSQLQGVVAAGGDERSCQHGWGLDGSCWTAAGAAPAVALRWQLLRSCSLVCRFKGLQCSASGAELARGFRPCRLATQPTPEGPCTAVAVAICAAWLQGKGVAVQYTCSICCKACRAHTVASVGTAPGLYVYIEMCVCCWVGGWPQKLKHRCIRLVRHELWAGVRSTVQPVVMLPA